MASKQTVRAAVVCHKGCVRSNNEDNFFFNGNYMSLNNMNDGAVIEHSFSSKCQLYGVFDGMGGGDWGERASALAAQSIQSVYLNMKNGDVEKLLNDYALKTNARIVEDGRAHQVDTQGTTMAVALFRGSECHVANVGDSRVYLLRDHKLKQLSMDHSVVGDLVRQGILTSEQARKSSKNNVITQYLGMPDSERPAQLMYYTKTTLQPGDRLMLCSDGLCDLMSNAVIEEYLATNESTKTCARHLVMNALELGGKDNTTCIVVDFGEFKARLPQPPQTAGMFPGVVASADAPKAATASAAQEDKPAWFTASLNNQPVGKSAKPAAKKTEDTDTSLL